MPALAVPEGAKLGPHLNGAAAPHPPMEALGCSGSSAVQTQTAAQPSRSMHEGSSAGRAALAPDGLRTPRDGIPSDNSSSQKPESSQALADPQANGQPPAAEDGPKEHPPEELLAAKAGTGEHVSGDASLQDSGMQDLQQEAGAVLPAEDPHCPSGADKGPQDSSMRQPSRDDCAGVKDGKLAMHDNASSMQAAEESRPSDDPGGGAPPSAVEIQICKGHASGQISDADGVSGDGMRDLQLAEHTAGASADPSSISDSARPVDTEVAQQSGLPQEPARGTPTPGWPDLWLC